jgi:hypothetical protein
MKKTNFKVFYVILDIATLEIRLCSTKQKVADILGIHRNSVKIGEKPILRGNLKVFRVREE